MVHVLREDQRQTDRRQFMNSAQAVDRLCMEEKRVDKRKVMLQKADKRQVMYRGTDSNGSYTSIMCRQQTSDVYRSRQETGHVLRVRRQVIQRKNWRRYKTVRSEADRRQVRMQKETLLVRKDRSNQDREILCKSNIRADSIDHIRPNEEQVMNREDVIFGQVKIHHGQTRNSQPGRL